MPIQDKLRHWMVNGEFIFVMILPLSRYWRIELSLMSVSVLILIQRYFTGSFTNKDLNAALDMCVYHGTKL